MTLYEHAQGRDNNFNLIRFMAAFTVLAVHCQPLLGLPPLTGPIAWFGGSAVGVFFLTSGFLITSSLMSRKNVIEFAWARSLRIFPGLWAMLLITVVGLGLLVGKLPASEFFSSPITQDYFTRCATLVNNVRFTLPGLFEDNPYKSVVNGSLWTLPIEWRLYEYLAAGWVLLALKPEWRLWTFRLGVPALALLFFAKTYQEHEILAVRFDTSMSIFMFLYGATLYLWRRFIELSPTRFVLLAAGLFLASFVPRLFFIVYLLVLPPLTLHFAYLFGGIIRNFNRLGDYSYGLYIYAMPIQQTLVSFFPNLSILQLIVASFVLTLTCAVASWHLLEKRALAHKSDFAAATMRLFDHWRDRFALLRAGWSIETRIP